MIMQERKLHDRLVVEENPELLYSRLKKEKLPLLLWGLGDVAASVKQYLDLHDIPLYGAFSDVPTSNELLTDIPVYSINQVEESLEQYNVILGHSSYDLGEEFKRNHPKVNKVFYKMGVFYLKQEIIDMELVTKNLNEYDRTCDLLEDEFSKECLIAFLNALINNNPKYLFPKIKPDTTYFRNDFFEVGKQEVFVDVGAYDGDSIRPLLVRTSGCYSKIFAIEPDSRNRSKLEEYIEKNGLRNIKVVKEGTWKEKTVLYLNTNGDQESMVSSAQDNADDQIEVDTLDSICEMNPVTMIKINFYPGAFETLQGAEKLIQKYRPKLAIVVGMDMLSLIELPRYLKRIVPEYRLGLRFLSGMAERLVLFAY